MHRKASGMNSQRILGLFITGTALILIGLGLMMESSPAAAQGADLEYYGISECSECHRAQTAPHRETAHFNTLRRVRNESDAEAILADFSSGAELRSVTFPGEGAARSFEAADVAYIVGAGRNEQRYVTEAEDGTLYVLPAQWVVAENVWKALPGAEEWPSPAYDFNQNCAYCHVTGYDVEKASWAEAGVSCESCHGPGSEHVELVYDAGRSIDEDEMQEIRAAIQTGVDSQSCGQCHQRGSSPDGHPYPAGFIPGQDLGEFITTFGPDDSAHFWITGHASQPNMQYNEWLHAGHANALSSLLARVAEPAESCLTCHSADASYIQRTIAAVEAGDREEPAPEALTFATAQFGVTCASCHNPHMPVDSPYPANLISEPYALCASCHSNEAFEGRIHYPSVEMYEGRDLIAGIAGVPGVHFTDPAGPRCASCHLPEVPTSEGLRASHALNPVMPGAALNVEALVDTCSACHSNVLTPELLQTLMDDIQADTQARIEAARAVVTDDTPEWVKQALDFVEKDGSLGVHNYAYADELLDAVFTELGLFANETAAAGN